MFRGQAQQQFRAYIALMAIACVLFLCWSQQSNLGLAGCPLKVQKTQQAQHQQADASAATHLVADCDASGHLLQQAHANILDGGAALSLFIVLVLLLLARQSPAPVAQSPPPLRRYRPHLVFCVFNE